MLFKPLLGLSKKMLERFGLPSTLTVARWLSAWAKYDPRTGSQKTWARLGPLWRLTGRCGTGTVGLARPAPAGTQSGIGARPARALVFSLIPE
jgi:hypothetical protein